MFKKFLIRISFLLCSISAFSMPDEQKANLANQCYELSQKIEELKTDQTSACSSMIQEAAKLVDLSGKFILKEYWFNARTNLHRSYRLLTDTNKMNCNNSSGISLSQKNIDGILEQIYGLE